VTDRPSVCAEIEMDLVASALGEAGPAAAGRVGAHLDRCASCRDEVRRYQAIDAEVATLRGRPLAEARVDRVEAELRARLRDLRGRLVLYHVFPSPFGHILIARSEQGIALVEYLGRGTRLAGSRLARLPGVEPVADGRDLEAFHRELAEYLEGRRRELRWPIDLRLVRSDFHRDVLATTSSVPYGAVISYAGLAREVGRPSAVRAVAQALRWNPLPIVIPCHRVIGSSGALTGYAGGATTRKQKLLSVEGIPTVRMRGDFRIARETMYVRAPGDPEYCLPTCASVDPFPVGGLLFASRDRAEAAGLAPCTACRPDLHPLSR